MINKAITRAIADSQLSSNQKTYKVRLITEGKGGFPVKFSRIFSQIDIESTSKAPQPLSLSLGKTKITAKSYWPLSWSMRHDGDLRVDLITPQGEQFKANIKPLILRSDIRLGLDQTLKNFSARLTGVKIENLGDVNIPIKAVQSYRIDAKQKGQVLSAKMITKNLVLDETVLSDAGQILGSTFARLDIDAQVDAIDVLRQGRQQDWLNADPTVKIHNFHVIWGSLNITGEIDITAANTLWSGELTLRIKDGSAVIDDISPLLNIDPKDALKYKAVLDVSPQTKDGRAEITLSIKDNALSFFGRRIDF